MAQHTRPCDDCDVVVAGPTLDRFCDAFVDHHRRSHPEFGFPEVVLRNFAAATQRLAEPQQQVQPSGPPLVHPVMPDHLDDWLDFFDHAA